MTLFFLVVGLEAKRELDLGQLRERKRIAIPVVAALGGILAPIAIFLAINAGGAGREGLGRGDVDRHGLRPRRPRARRAQRDARPGADAHARDRRRPRRAHDHRGRLHRARRVRPAADRGRLFAVLAVALRQIPARLLAPTAALFTAAIWVALHASGIDPLISGLAVGLLVSAYQPVREDLEQVVERVRSFREQPTPELARSAQRGVVSAISPNERIQYGLHPWTSFVIVPLFAVANTGVRIDGDLLSRAVTSPITLGIFFGYVVGKPLGITSATLAVDPPARRDAVGEPAGDVRGRGQRRDRVHRRAAHLEHRVRRRPPGRGEDRRAGRGVASAFLAWVAVRGIAAPAGARPRPPALGHGGRPRRPLRRRQPRARPHPRRRRRAGHARRVRRLPVPLLRPGGGRDPPAARLLRRRAALRLAAPAARGRPPERPARGRGGRGGGRPGAVLGDARHAAHPPGRAVAARPAPRTRPRSGSTSTASSRTCGRASTPSASPTTCAAPTRAASPARRRSSSTASATRAPTTSRRSPRPSVRRAPGRPPSRSRRRSEPSRASGPRPQARASSSAPR